MLPATVRLALILPIFKPLLIGGRLLWQIVVMVIHLLHITHSVTNHNLSNVTTGKSTEIGACSSTQVMKGKAWQLYTTMAVNPMYQTCSDV